ncbi:hypothetical protein JOF56_011177 [Kibdelosporangium banguiense]|uniref:Immunity protein 35 n=1 Tax=Kibdelosporangium banguiense TaxID=1365924 RepID=A0ABS4U2B0_9PSEU|nr:hypothetical protein [Kibdelosporangium banguiense]MBP2330792.1 hypothetical protein [Kibdelosporangium banguiense]
MVHTTDISTTRSSSQPQADDTDFTTLVAEMVADQAPRVFAIVLEYGEQIDAQIIGRGMALDESAYVTTVDGKNQYLLAEPENALKYLPSHPDTTPHLVWAAPLTNNQ